MEGVVLAVGEALEAVDHERFLEGRPGPVLLVVEQQLASQTPQMGQDGGGGAVEEAGDLPETGAGEQPLEDRGVKVGASQPVGGLEGLSAEGAAAV